MANHQPLPFLRGTFSWSKLGYFFASHPPVDLLAPEVLTSDNPWLVVAAALERAKRGDHRLIPRLQQWFHTSDEGYLDRICILLTGDAGREDDVRQLPSLMFQGPDDVRTYACEAAALAGCIWLVPSMLEAWRRVTSLADHETIGYAIANMLEEPAGPIAAEAGTHNLDSAIIEGLEDPETRELRQKIAPDQPSLPTFEVLVRAWLSKSQNKFGSDQVVIWRGERFQVHRLAEDMLKQVRAREPGNPAISFIPERHKFEATTGINCPAFFREGSFQPLAAAEILESFLEGTDAAKYEDGVRYFFGHRIPD